MRSNNNKKRKGQKMKTMKSVINETCHEDYEGKLFRAVMRQLSATWDEVWEYPENFRTADAGVGGFTYYNETEPFARRNMVEIMQCLNEFEQELGEPLKKDNDNLLNWLAWFALEHIIDKVMVCKESA